ncbi:hypothetical protein [Ruegeria sp.]
MSRVYQSFKRLTRSRWYKSTRWTISALLWAAIVVAIILMA